MCGAGTCLEESLWTESFADSGLMQTLSVLNPMARIDQHIMDDSDLAGPILFFLLFGFFLLFVCTFLLSLTISTRAGMTDQWLCDLVWKSALWVYLRLSSPRLDISAFYYLANVPTDRSLDTSSNGSRPTLCLGRPLLQHSDFPSISISSRILPPPIGPHLPCWRGGPYGHCIWLHHNDGRHRMVHVQQQRHVLCCRSYARYERIGGIPFGIVLCGLWYHGYFLKPRNRWTCKRCQRKEHMIRALHKHEKKEN